MFAYIFEWIENIAFYLVIIVAMMHLVPGEQYKRYIRFFVGMILILMLITPMLKIVGMTEYPKEQYEEMMEKIDEVTAVGR